jgi:hypothetical protein
VEDAISLRECEREEVEDQAKALYTWDQTKARDQLAQPFQVISKPNLNQGDAKGKSSRTEKRRFIPRFNQKPMIFEMVVRCHGRKMEIAEMGSTAIVNQNEILRHSGVDQDKTLRIYFSIRFSANEIYSPRLAKQAHLLQLLVIPEAYAEIWMHLLSYYNNGPVLYIKTLEQTMNTITNGI